MRFKKSRKDIIEFIAKFTGSEETFLHGCCFWFAWILAGRMEFKDSEIYYEPAEGHFITKIGNRYYDIRGDVTELYEGYFLYKFSDLEKEDPKLYKQLVRECVMMEGD